MEKYSVFGELLYIGSVYEKGRCKSNGYWKWGYKKLLFKHIDIMKQMIQCMLIDEITDRDAIVIEKFIELTREERDIGRCYSISKETIQQLQECNYSIIDAIDLSKSSRNINLFMNDIAKEILETLGRNMTVNKKKVAMLIRVMHNLPRIYLGSDLQTLCKINQPSIEYKDAIEYSFSNMDEETRNKYREYFYES